MTDGEGSAALVGALASAVVLVIGSLTAYFLQRRQADLKSQAEREEREAKVKRDAYDEALSQYQGLIARLEAQVERHDAAAAEARRVVEDLQRFNADCREEAAEQRQALRYLYEQVRRLHAAMIAGKLDPGPLPDPPTLRERHTKAEGEFLARQVAQSAVLVEAARQEIEVSRPKPPEAKS
jgi:small-conductance mechanosensitive channel